jgi:hypothetical protein
MRKIGFIPYKNTQKEILPKSYRIGKRNQQRRMLIAMLNEYLPEAARFPTTDTAQYDRTIPEIFNEQILSFFQCCRLRPERPQRVLRIYRNESQLFGQFFNYSRHPRARWFARRIPHCNDFHPMLGYSHPAAHLIQLIFDGREIRMTLDLDTLFAQTVYHRIKREPSKQITLDMPYIHINQNGVRTRLYPRWKKVDPSLLQQRSSDIENGLKQLDEEEIDQLYLVYPKTETFQRHIQIKNDQTDQLKLIPYSFTFSQKERKTCKP